jgi:hypothetical protein
MMNNAEGSQGRIDRSGDELGDINPKGSNVASEVRDGIGKIVDGVKEKISTDAVRKVSETASQVSDQVKGYIEDRGMRGLADDATAVIRRYPVPAVVLGILIGVLLARPRGD